MAKKQRSPSDFLKIVAPKEYLEFWISVFKESHRGMVLLSAAFFDEHLGYLHFSHLSAHIRDPDAMYEKLSSRFGPLADFAAKIQLGYAYGLLDKETYVELEKLRKLRNEVAHELTSFSFDDPRIANRVLEFKKFPIEELFDEVKKRAADPSYVSYIIALEKYWLSQKNLVENEKPKPIGHFTAFAMLMSMRLMILTIKASERTQAALEQKVNEAGKLLEASQREAPASGH